MGKTDRPSLALEKSHTLSRLRYTQVVSQPHYDVDVEMVLNYKDCYTSTDLFLLSMTDLSPTFLDHLFVSDWRTNSVFRMRKRDGGENVILRKGISGIMNVKAYSADLQDCE